MLVLPLVGSNLFLFRLLLKAKDEAIARERVIGTEVVPIMQTMSELLNQVPTKIERVIGRVEDTQQRDKAAIDLAAMQRALARVEKKLTRSSGSD